jgi:predicted amino acid dehydrogenase
VDSFAFIIHPIDPKRDIGRKYPFLAKIVNDWIIDHVAPLFPPVYLSEIEGIRSNATGKVIKGWLIACPLTPKHFFRLPEKQVYRKIIETGRLAEKLGADILGLGAYTSVVGDAGHTVAQALEIPVTTGDAYTIAVAVQAILVAAQMLGIDPGRTSAAVVGATGAIGQACSALLSKEVGELTLLARREVELELLRAKLKVRKPKAEIHISTDMHVLHKARLILTVTSAIHEVIPAEVLPPGSVVCDVARPRDVSATVAVMRPDVLVIDGGMVEVPGEVNFHFDFGLPAGKAYACMAETMALALEGRFEDYTIGKDISIEHVEEIAAIASKHGFTLSGFRSFEKPVTEEQIEHVRQYADQSLIHKGFGGRYGKSPTANC